MYSLTYMYKCASQYPDTLLVFIFCLTLLFYWVYLVLFTFSYICNGSHYGPEYGFHWWIFYMLLRRIYTRLLLFAGVFYKYKFNKVDDFFFFALLFLSITGKEISKPPKIIVNLHISSTNLLATAHVFWNSGYICNFEVLHKKIYNFSRRH